MARASARSASTPPAPSGPGTAVEAHSPSFLAVHPSLPVVYAVGEQAQTVQAYRRSGAFGLEPVGPARTAGEAPCHVAVDPFGRFLTVACYQETAACSSSNWTATARSPRGSRPPPRWNPAVPAGPHASLMLADSRVMTATWGTICCGSGITTRARAWFRTTKFPCPRKWSPAPGPASQRQRVRGDRVLERGGRCAKVRRLGKTAASPASSPATKAGARAGDSAAEMPSPAVAGARVCGRPRLQPDRRAGSRGRRSTLQARGRLLQWRDGRGTSARSGTAGCAFPRTVRGHGRRSRLDQATGLPQIPPGGLPSAGLGSLADRAGSGGPLSSRTRSRTAAVPAATS